MSYTALYRKFRPNTFEEVKGQDHIVTTLKNQIHADRIGHAYLFCGTRGTGKTSIAKIFARAVNCEHPVNGSPCNECPSCKAAFSGVSMNIIEIDAASNNGVDNIREIRDEVQYSPTEGRFKVYIIDEVHMLSIGAFNALLKTLEEPPAYVIFILATTEAHKIPITILSRCQRYDFRRISMDTIASHLGSLMQKEGIEVEGRALRYIAKAADGALRDALSLLDQCLAFYMDQALTYDKVLEVLGVVDTEVFSKLLRRVLAQDTLGVIRELDDLVMSGKDLTQFIVDFTWYLRNLLLMQSTDQAEDILDISTESKKALLEEATMVEPAVLMRYIRIFSELSGQMKFSVQKRVVVEIALVKLTKPEMEQDNEALLNRISNLEQIVAQGIAAQPSVQEMPSNQLDIPKEKKEESYQPAQSKDIAKLMEKIPEIIRQAGYPMKSYLKQCNFQEGGLERLILVTIDEMAYGYLSEERNRIHLEEIFSKSVEKQISVDIKLIEEAEKNKSVFLEAQKKIYMEIGEED